MGVSMWAPTTRHDTCSIKSMLPTGRATQRSTLCSKTKTCVATQPTNSADIQQATTAAAAAAGCWHVQSLVHGKLLAATTGNQPSSQVLLLLLHHAAAAAAARLLHAAMLTAACCCCEPLQGPSCSTSFETPAGAPATIGTRWSAGCMKRGLLAICCGSAAAAAGIDSCMLHAAAAAAVVSMCCSSCSTGSQAPPGCCCPSWDQLKCRLHDTWLAATCCKISHRYCTRYWLLL